MRTIPTICIWFVVANTIAQPLEHAWTNRVGGPSDGEKLWRCAVDENGNVYAAGGFRGTFTDQGVSVTSVGNSDILLVKYSPGGELLWARSAGGPYGDIAFGVESDKEGNVYITGAYSGLAIFGDTLIANIDPDGVNLPFSFIARYSPNGDLRWVRTVDTEIPSSFYPYCVSYGIKLDRFGDLVATGSYSCNIPDQDDPEFSTMSFGGFPFRTCDLSAYDHVYAMKIDTLGNTEWVHSVGGIQALGVTQSIAFDGLNNIWLGGQMNGTLDFESGAIIAQGNGSARQGLVYQLDPEGSPLGAFLVDATLDSNVEDLLVAANGEVFLSGWYKGSLNGSSSASGYDGFMMRTTPQGSAIWTNRLTGIGDDFFSGIATTPTPNEVVGGAIYFFQADFAGSTLAQSVGTNSALIRMDTMGVILEVVQPEVISGSTLVADVQSDIYGNFFLCGDITGQAVFTDDTLVCSSQDMYVTKISPQQETGFTSSRRDRSGLSIWPNPASGPVSIRVPADTGLLEIVDGAGRTVRSMRMNNSQADFDASLLPQGIYQVSASGPGTLATGRLVVMP